jgi:hypothetical protein
MAVPERVWAPDGPGRLRAAKADSAIRKRYVKLLQKRGWFKLMGWHQFLIGPQDEILMLPLAWSLRKVTTLA